LALVRQLRLSYGEIHVQSRQVIMEDHQVTMEDDHVPMERLTRRRACRLRRGVSSARRSGRVLAVLWLLAAGVVLAACAGSTQSAAGTGGNVRIRAVGAENQYANVIGQIGGKFVAVSAIESNPDTDPHTFEVSARVAQQIAAANLVVQNGLGYDSWATKTEAATPSSTRKVIDVQTLLHLPDTTPNPHLWYKPTTMPVVARAIADDLTALKPADGAYFATRLRAFDRSLQPWDSAIARFKDAYAGTPVAVTEPVADYLLQAAGCDIRTPFSLQAAIMNGTDPSPEDVAAEDRLLTNHQVDVFVYNQQVTDSLTQSFASLARTNGIPVVGVYETMPTPGYDYQSWMIAEVAALSKAIADRVSTTRL